LALKPLLFQYSLYRLIAYSMGHSAAPIKLPPGADRPPPPLSYATAVSQSQCSQNVIDIFKNLREKTYSALAQNHTEKWFGC